MSNDNNFSGVIPTTAFVIPATTIVIPATTHVIPAKAGISFSYLSH